VDTDLFETMNDNDGAMDVPFTILEQMAMKHRCGEKNWYLKRRASFPAAEMPENRETLVLPLDMLKEAPRDPLEAFIPEEAPFFPGGARTIGQPRPNYLRRFNGGKVLPLNVTQIFNGESRQVYRDTSFPWVCIGRLFRPDGNWGTATLVGRRVILTASHVLAGLWQPGQPLTQRITFIPACFDNVSLLGSDWTAQVVNIAAWETIQAVDGYDMAICQLDKPMGKWLGALGARSYDDDWQDLAVWAHVGYPYDLSMGGQRPTFELGISVHDDDSDSYDTLEVETKADSASGQSGGPLWGVFRDGGHQVIGTLSGIEDNFAEPKNSLFAGGNGLVNLIRWGRDNWN
jgi:V8-like Glu-specific endopeptidase